MEVEKFRWIKHSTLYKTLSDNNEKIPLTHLTSIYSKNIKNFFITIKYWGVTKLPDEFYNLLLKDKEKSLKFVTDLNLKIILESENMVNAAVQVRNKEFFKYLYENSYEIDKEYVGILAAEYGALDILEYAFLNDFPLTIQTCFSAAKHNQLECLKYCYENGASKNKGKDRKIVPFRTYEFDIPACCAEYGSLECLKYILTKERISNATLYSAVKHYDITKYLCENYSIRKFRSDDTVLNCAFTEGSFETAKYLSEKGFVFSEGTFTFTAGKGHLKRLMYLIEKGCPHSYMSLIDFVESGNIEVIKYVMNLGYKYNKELSVIAAEKGHLHVLKYFKECSDCSV